MVSGYGGYFNIQQSATPGIDWMFEIYFDDAGGGYINAGGSNAATVSYTPETWTDIRVKMDLTNDLGELIINGASVHTWQWSLGATGTGAAKAAGGVDIFAAAANSGIGDFYVDDVLLEESFPTGIISTGAPISMFIAPNPSNGQFNIGINNLPAGNYQLELVDLVGRVIKSEQFQASGSISKQINESLPGGVYYVRLTDGSKSTTKKIVVN